MDMLPSISSWHVKELLYNCLPERFSSGNHTEVCVLRGVKEDLANIIAPLMLKPITRLPFFAFLGGAMFCLLVSSVCHLVSCHSERLSYIMLRLDYTGIASLICTSLILLPSCVLHFYVLSLLLQLVLGFYNAVGHRRAPRFSASLLSETQIQNLSGFPFLWHGSVCLGPILHKLYLFWGEPEVFHTTGYEVLMGFFYGVGALVYAARVPKRWTLANSTLRATATNSSMYWS